MKIVLTGSLGNIGKPLAQKLVQKGHTITVISSCSQRQKDIEALGAKAAIGTMQDADFLATAFKENDVAYLMEAVPRTRFFDPNLDIVETYSQIARNYKQAVEKSGVKKLIHLSSIGAHTAKGNGLLAMHYYAEQILDELPEDVNIKFMRPVSFFTNLYWSLPTIKIQNAIISNYGGDRKEPWVSPLDVATIIADEIETSFRGREVRYIASDEVSPNEIAQNLGKAIGKTDLKWLKIEDDELLDNMLSEGMNRQIAKGFVEMHAAQRDGTLYEDYYKYKPQLGKTRLADFAQEFARVLFRASFR